jgi:hypothetical protein
VNGCTLTVKRASVPLFGHLLDTGLTNSSWRPWLQGEVDFVLPQVEVAPDLSLIVLLFLVALLDGTTSDSRWPISPVRGG